MTWFVVTNEEGCILAVYGSALLSVAQEKARSIENQTGCKTFLRTVLREWQNKPHVGQTLPLGGVNFAFVEVV